MSFLAKQIPRGQQWAFSQNAVLVLLAIVNQFNSVNFQNSSGLLKLAFNTGDDGDWCSFHRYTAINAAFALIIVELHNDYKHI